MIKIKNDIIKTNLFSCPIYKIRIDPNSYDKEKIINDIKYNKSLKNTRNEQKEKLGVCDIHFSYDDHNNVNFRPINYEKLIDVYLEIFNEFFNNEISTIKEFGFDFLIQNYSAMTEGQWLSAHNHVRHGDDFTSIHYLNFKKEHVLTTFHNPATFSPYINIIRPELNYILNDKTTDNSYFWEFYEFPVEEDDILIFPTVLYHEILPQGPTKEPRITISTNIKINDT